VISGPDGDEVADLVPEQMAAMELLTSLSWTHSGDT
jgi:hypothetical protein